VFKVHEGRPHGIDLIVNGQVQLLVNTPLGQAAQKDDYTMRKAAIARRVPYTTTLSAARAACDAVEALRAGELSVRPLQEWHTQLPGAGLAAPRAGGTWEFDGGAFMNQASHYVDLVQWLMGPVESVIAKTATLARRIEAEDSGAAVMRFRSGALGVMEVTMLTFPRNLEGSITLLGERGTVKIGGTAVNRVEHWQFADYDDDDKLVDAANTNPPSVYGFGHEAYYRNVLAVLRGEAPPETDGRAGRKSLELILGIYESARTGREVPIPLKLR
jgi:predicted dehydrogenase